MIQDVFKLKKDSWHMKLMTRIWGFHHYDFPNMCPYFWLSVLNIIIAPFFVLAFTIAPIFSKIADYIEKQNDKRKIACAEEEQKWINEMERRIAKEPSHPSVIKLAREYQKYQWSDKLAPFRKRWFFNSYNSDITGKLLEIVDGINKEEKEKRKVKNTNRTEIANYTVKIKYLAKAAGIGIILFAGYWFVKLLIFLSTLDWGYILWKIWEGFLIGVIILLFIFIVYWVLRLLVIGIYKFWCRYGAMCIPCSERREKLGDIIIIVLKGIASPFVWTFRGGKQLFYVLKALKDNNCPGIEWEE